MEQRTEAQPCLRGGLHLLINMWCLYECYKALWSKKRSMGPVKVFKTPEYTVKQPPDPVVCRTPSNGIVVRSVRIREDRSPRER